jgi:hypothetical protein
LTLDEISGSLQSEANILQDEIQPSGDAEKWFGRHFGAPVRREAAGSDTFA